MTCTQCTGRKAVAGLVGSDVLPDDLDHSVVVRLRRDGIETLTDQPIAFRPIRLQRARLDVRQPGAPEELACVRTQMDLRAIFQSETLGVGFTDKDVVAPTGSGQ